MIPRIPIIKRMIKNFIFTPATKRRLIIVKIIIIPLPKSGSNMIRPKIKSRMVRIGNTPFL